VSRLVSHPLAIDPASSKSMAPPGSRAIGAKTNKLLAAAPVTGRDTTSVAGPVARRGHGTGREILLVRKGNAS